MHKWDHYSVKQHINASKFTWDLLITCLFVDFYQVSQIWCEIADTQVWNYLHWAQLGGAKLDNNDQLEIQISFDRQI